MSRRQSSLRTSYSSIHIIILFAVLARSSSAFTFAWSATSYQCYTQDLTWSGGTPPFTAVIAPLLQFPFVYHIPSSAYNSATKTGSYPIQLQLSSGFSYVLYMNDATGSGTGGSTPLIQVQGYQDSGCLAKQSLAKNQTSARFTYETENDNVVQCTQSLGISWDASNGTAPYNMTVIPFYQDFNPFDVPLGTNGSYDWQVNVRAGTYFSILMSDSTSLGSGGVGGSYRVNASATADSSCFGVTSTTSVASTGTSMVTGTMKAGNGTIGGGDGGGVGGGSGPTSKTVDILAAVGAVVAVAAIAAAVYFYLALRKRRRAEDGSSGKNRKQPRNNSVDLFDGPMSNSGQHHRDGTTSPGNGMDSPADLSLHNYSPLGLAGGSYDNLPGTGSVSSLPTSAGAAGQGVYPKNGLSWPGAAVVAGSERRGSGTSASRTHRAMDNLGVYENPFAGSVEDITSAGNARSPTPGSEAFLMENQSSGQRQTLPRIRTAKWEEAEREAGMGGPSGENTLLPPIPQSSPLFRVPPTTGGFRVTNATADDPIAPENAGALSPSASTPNNTSSLPPNQPRRFRGDQQPRFVRHEDAGLAPGQQRQSREEVIDLPPLYTDIVPTHSEDEVGSAGPRSAREDRSEGRSPLEDDRLMRRPI